MGFWRFQLVPRTQEGQIYPPLVSVSYTDVLIKEANSQTVSVSRPYILPTEARTKQAIALKFFKILKVFKSQNIFLWKKKVFKFEISSPQEKFCFNI